MKESIFEKQLIEYLSTGQISDEYVVNLNQNSKGYLSRMWEYRPDIKTTEDLWQNFKEILEQHNKQVIDRPLSITEFNQVKKKIIDLKSSYDAGQFLYGLNGISQIDISTDDEG